MKTPLEFNRATFGLPVETFRIVAYISLEERLPVVTEYVLRLLKICGQIPLSSFRDYFGFSDGETLAIVESLCRQGLLDVSDEDVQLSQFADERFEEAGGDHPRFSKVDLKKDTVTFDLISFTPLKSHPPNKQPTNNIIKLDAPEELIGHSIDRARDAYRKRYPEIASMRSDLREKSHGVYAVEDVESKSRNYVPIPVSFLMNFDGQVQRNIDRTFEQIAPPDLLRSFNEQVTTNIPRISSLGMLGLEEFIDTFNLSLMKKHFTGDKFDLNSYLAETITRSTKYPKGMDMIFGNIYLKNNRDLIVKRIQDRRSGKLKQGKMLSSLAWMAPNYSLWGRGEDFSETVNIFLQELGTFGDTLYVFAYAEIGQDTEISNQFRISKPYELHFSRPILPDCVLMEGRLEILLYPTGFMTALYHLSVSDDCGLWLPIGFISTLPKHLDKAHELLKKAMSGNRYGGSARFTQSGRHLLASFEENCPFLNYSRIIGDFVDITYEDQKMGTTDD